MKMSLFLLFPLFLLAFPTLSSGSYCICKDGLSDQILQKAIDFACGAGADCNPIRPNGQCYNPNTVVNHCSYAVNNYFQKKAASGATCDFGGAAQLTNSAPSGGCLTSGSTGSGSSGTGATGPVTTVPSSSPPTGTTPISGGTPTTPISGGTPTTTPGSGGTGGTGGIGTGGTGVGVTPTTGTTPTTASPYGTTPTPSSGILGGGVGMAPTGSSMDDSASGWMERASLGSILAMILVSGVMCWWN